MNKFKVLMYRGGFVDTTYRMLDKGIYTTEMPHLYPPDMTLDVLIERTEKFVGEIGVPYSKSCVEHLRKCELVTVTLNIE